MRTRYKVRDYFAQWGYIFTFFWLCVTLTFSFSRLQRNRGNFCRRVPVVLVSQARRRFSCYFFGLNCSRRGTTFHLIMSHIILIFYFSCNIYFSSLSFSATEHADHLNRVLIADGEVYFRSTSFCCHCLLRTNVSTYIFLTTERAVNNIFVNVSVHTV